MDFHQELNDIIKEHELKAREICLLSVEFIRKQSDEDEFLHFLRSKCGPPIQHPWWEWLIGPGLLVGMMGLIVIIAFILKWTEIAFTP